MTQIGYQNPPSPDLTLDSVIRPGGNFAEVLILGDPTSNTNAVIKAASTPAVGADPALVVTLSPNNGVKLLDGAGNAISSTAGALNVNVTGGSGSNAAAGPTGSPVPTSADYLGFNVAGNLVGVSSANPLPVNIANGSIAVTGTFFQATQPISGTIAVSNFPGTQPISGSVSVSNFPASQAVTNAGTFAVQATLPVGQAFELLDSGGVNKASISAGGALTVDGSAVTQPVSGTITANAGTGNFTVVQPTGANLHVVVDSAPTIAVTLPAGQAVELLDGGGTNKASISAAGAVKVDGSAVTQPVSGTFFQATQPVSGTITVTQATGTNLHMVVDSGTITAVTAITNALPAGTNVIGHIIADTGSTTAVTGNVTVVQPTGTNLHAVIDSGTITATVSGSVSVSNFPATQPVSGTITVTQATGSNLHVVVDTAPSTAVTNAGTFAVQATLPAGQAMELLDGGGTNKASISAGGALKVDGSAATQPVSGTVAVSNFPASQAVTNAGTFAVQATLAPSTSGGLLTADGAITNTVTAVKASAGQLYGWYFYNANATVVYCQLFDLATGSVTLGTTVPKLSFGIPPGAGANILGGQGIAFGTAISVAFTTTRAGSTAPVSVVDYNFFYL